MRKTVMGKNHYEELTIGDWVLFVISLLIIGIVSYFLIKALGWYGYTVFIILVTLLSMFISVLTSDPVAATIAITSILFLIALFESEYQPILKLLEFAHATYDHHKVVLSRRISYSSFRNRVKGGSVESFESEAKSVIE